MNPDAFQTAPGEPIRLADIDPSAYPPGTPDEAAAEARVGELGPEIAQAHHLVMAHETRGLVVLFQGMDASGKDEAIRDVLAYLDPRGTEFKQFKKLGGKEARHDYLWRASAALPARGQVGVFNRSYYEHVTGERVDPEGLGAQNLPEDALEDVWAKRFRQINAFEQYLSENGIALLKLFLHVSKEAQRKRLLERLNDPDASWEFSAADLEGRACWDDFMEAYDEALTETNTPHAPWHVVPADRPWATRAAVAETVARALQGLHDGYPEPEDPAELDEARKTLEADA